MTTFAFSSLSIFTLQIYCMQGSGEEGTLRQFSLIKRGLPIARQREGLLKIINCDSVSKIKSARPPPVNHITRKCRLVPMIYTFPYFLLPPSSFFIVFVSFLAESINIPGQYISLFNPWSIYIPGQYISLFNIYPCSISGQYISLFNICIYLSLVNIYPC